MKIYHKKGNYYEIEWADPIGCKKTIYGDLEYYNSRINVSNYKLIRILSEQEFFETPIGKLYKRLLDERRAEQSKIRAEELKKYLTCELSRELESRTDVVKTTYYEPIDDGKTYLINAPCVILDIID